MIRRSAIPLFPVLLTVLALLTLRGLAAISDGLTLSEPGAMLYVAAILVIIAFTTVVEVPLQGDALSLGYSAGLMAVLVLGQRNDLFTTISVIGVGGLLGGAIRAFWRDWQVRRAPGWQTLAWTLVASAQLTLSMAAGIWVYRALNGGLPLISLRLQLLPALVGLVGISMILYVAIYALILDWQRLNMGRVFSNNRYTLLLALLTPVPFTIAGALVIRASFIGFMLLAFGLLVLALLATELGRQRLRFRQQVLELSSLSAVGRAMRANLDLDALLETIHLQVATLLEIDSFTLALYDPDRNLIHFPVVFREGRRRVQDPRPIASEPIDYVIERKAGLLFTDQAVQQAKTSGLSAPDGNPNTWLGVPLLASDRALGCIAIGANDPARHFSADDRRLLTAIAAQGAISIDNAQLYTQSQVRSRQLVTLNRLSALLSGTLDPGRVLELVSDSTLEIANADSAAIFLWWDDAQQALALVRSSGVQPSFDADPPMPLLLAKGVPDHLPPLIILEARTDPQAEPVRAAMQREGYAAWIELPLRNGTDVLGVLAAYYRKPQRFDSEEIELLRAFSNQAALSISNARLYRRTDEALEQRIAQLSALASINQELASTLNLQHLFALVLDHALEGTHSSSGVLLLRPDSAQPDAAPRIVAQRGQNIRKTTEMLIRPTTTRAFQTNQFAVDRSSLPELSVPIARDMDVMGVITLHSVERDAYEPDDILFVRQLATQAVIAIDNARLFSRIEESRDRLQVILDSMHEAVLLIDASGTVLLANPQIGYMFDLSPKTLTGRTLESLLAEPQLHVAESLGFEATVLNELINMIQDGRWQGGSSRKSYRIEQPIVRFIDRTIVSTHSTKGRLGGLLMVFSDATEERELTQAREDLTRMIVHDLRSPLTAISTSMRLLMEMAPADPALARMLTLTTDASQRALRKLLNLVDSLLDIAKIESGSMTLERVEHMLAPIAQNVRMELMPLADELDIKVELTIPDNLPHLFIDASKIERVLLNLVDNALKFTPYNGLVQIRARPEPVEAGFVRVEVSDTGPGIPDDYKERIFDRFEQVDGATGRRRGTGLGLTFCKLTVEAHGGHIWIEDNPTGGSVFVLTLPTINSVRNPTVPQLSRSNRL